MKDYSAMSDFEINKQVAIALELKPYYEDGSYSNDGLFVVTRGPRCLGRWSPCNEPHQAWPIIQERGISLNYDGIDWIANDIFTNVKASNNIETHAGKPLRAAMICYLKALDMEKGHG